MYFFFCLFAISILSYKLTQLPCPPEFKSIRNIDRSFHWNPIDPKAIVQYSICDSINTPCGEAGALCSTQSKACTGFCQWWSESEGEGGASIGNYSKFIRVNHSTVKLIYNHGDEAGVVPREGWIWVTQMPGSPPLKWLEFITATSHEPNEPYIYQLFLSTNLLGACSVETSCDGCTNSSSCEWCLDDNTCKIKHDKNCQNFINSPVQCPDNKRCSKQNTCFGCTSSSCIWCLGESSGGYCSSDRNFCINGQIKNPKFC